MCVSKCGMNIFRNPGPNAYPFDHVSEITGLDGFTGPALKHKVVGVYPPAKVFPDKFQVGGGHVKHAVLADACLSSETQVAGRRGYP